MSSISNPKFNDASKLFFTSDHHFGHKNICEYSNRPFESLEQMEEQLIENWNRVVPLDGIVFHLGDMFLCNVERATSIFSRLNGYIHYINGNHEDATKNAHFRKRFFSSCQDYLRIKVRETDLDDVPKSGGYQDIVLFHYPIASWEKKSYGSFHLFGHVHNSFDSYKVREMDTGTVGSYNPRCMDVGVDCKLNPAYDDPSGGWLSGDMSGGEAWRDCNRTAYTPVSFAQVKEKLSRRSLRPTMRDDKLGRALDKHTDSLMEWQSNMLDGE